MWMQTIGSSGKESLASYHVSAFTIRFQQRHLDQANLTDLDVFKPTFSVQASKKLRAVTGAFELTRMNSSRANVGLCYFFLH